MIRGEREATAEAAVYGEESQAVNLASATSLPVGSGVLPPL